MNRRRQKGGVAILLVIALPVLLAMGSLAIDVGNLFLTRERMQFAADAAALAASTSLNNVNAGNSSLATTTAQSIAKLNGFTNGANSVSVSVTIPPGDPYHLSPNYASNTNYARINISQPVPLFFGQLVGISTMTVSANAVAGPTTVTSSGSLVSLLTLATTGAGSLNITGGSAVSAVNGAIEVSSTSQSGLSITGGVVITANTINLAGGYSMTGGAQLKATVNVNSSQISADPFAGLSLPAPPYTCTYTNYSVSGGNGVTLSPGTYCGGISLVGVNVITVKPGLYILDGGGLSVVGGSSMTGTGVTFYNTGTSSGSTSYGPISIVGLGSLQLSAPTSGAYLGMLFTQDTKNTQAMSFTGGSSNILAGNMHFPSANITLTGVGSMSQPVGITVAQNLTITGGGAVSFSTAYGGVTNGTTSSIISLYE